MSLIGNVLIKIECTAHFRCTAASFTSTPNVANWATSTSNGRVHFNPLESVVFYDQTSQNLFKKPKITLKRAAFALLSMSRLVLYLERGGRQLLKSPLPSPLDTLCAENIVLGRPKKADCKASNRLIRIFLSLIIYSSQSFSLPDPWPNEKRYRPEICYTHSPRL